MSVYRNAIKAAMLPFRAAWFLLLVANFLVLSAVCLVFAAFAGYWLALAFSYAFLPVEWTQALWAWGAHLYTHYIWIKVATISVFLLLVLPILKWPARDPDVDATRERKIARLNDDLIAARQQEQSRLKLQH